MKYSIRFALVPAIIVLSIVLLFIRCRKEGNRPVIISSNLVKGMKIGYYSNNGAVSDKIDFQYDQLNRVIHIKSYNLENYTPFPYDSNFRITFDYKNSELLPEIGTIFNHYLHSRTIHHLFYNNASQVIKDSIVLIPDSGIPPPTTSAVLEYSYETNKIFVRNSLFPSSPAGLGLTSANNNFILYGSGLNINGQDEYYDYDTGLNPLNNLNIAPIWHFICELNNPAYSFTSVWTLCNKNNLTRIKKDYRPATGTFIDTVSTFKYFYYPDGLTEKRILYGRGAGIQDTLYYYYN